MDDIPSIEEFIQDSKKEVNELNWLKIVGLGSHGVGKTALVKSFCENKFLRSYRPTIAVDYGFKHMEISDFQVALTFWDVSGHEDFQDVRKGVYNDTDICLLVYDVSNQSSFQVLKQQFKEFKVAVGLSCVFALVGNKNDLGKSIGSCMEPIESFAERHHLKHYYTSCTNGEGVSKMFYDVVTQALDKRKPASIKKGLATK